MFRTLLWLALVSPVLAQTKVSEEATFLGWLSHVRPSLLQEAGATQGFLGGSCGLRVQNEQFEVYDCRDVRIPGLGSSKALLLKTRVSDGARAALTIEAPGLKLGSVLARYPEGRRQRLLTPHATEPLAEYSFKVGGVACSLLFSEADENLYVREISLEFMPERGR